MRFLFRKQQRVTQQKKVALLFNKGKRFRIKGLLCYYLPYAGLPRHQVLISVGKKHIKKAVQRIKIKRRIREAYRQQQYKIPEAILGGTYLLAYVFVGKGASDQGYTAIYQAVSSAMERIKFIA
ncbi:MAG: ribonuclease P protein component [Bacteroidota bacterium]